ncbi:MAG: endonuclease III [Candidatus Woesearchaeota archaeon]|nr:endonuclease III [Candidatus Woesearchaeota archaeon]
MHNKAVKQLETLRKECPDATYYLTYETPFQLVMATILSAQCMDVVVNRVTPNLYKKYKKPEDVLQVTVEELAEDIKGITYFQAKAKYIKKACQTLVDDFNSEVPEEIVDLVKLSGVGKKTANAIQQNAFGKVNGVIVDTHVIRLGQRLGWTQNKNPEKIEKDLMAIFPKNTWKSIPHLLKKHGQTICTARKAKCDECILQKSCPKLV